MLIECLNVSGLSMVCWSNLTVCCEQAASKLCNDTEIQQCMQSMYGNGLKPCAKSHMSANAMCLPVLQAVV